MCSQIISLSAAPFTGSTITGNLFGANALFTANYLDPGGAYDRMLQELGWTGLRFPGGTVTERNFEPSSETGDRFFDTSRPSGLSDDGSARILTAPAAFEYVSDRELAMHFTLPSKSYFDPEAGDDGLRVPAQFGLYQLLDRVDGIIRGDYGEVNITSFVIGNEFWYRGLDPLQPEEYGQLVNALAPGMQALFDVYQAEQGGPEYWTQPMIAVQSGVHWIPGSNQAIWDQMSFHARESMDAVSQHFYPRTYSRIESNLRQFDRMDEWQDLEGVNERLEYIVTEWNIQNSPESDTALAQASGMLEMMRQMVLRDVDYATVWGTQYFNLGSRLAALRADPDAPGGFEYTLTAPGEVFRMMSESLPGLQVIDIDTPEELRGFLNVPPSERPPEFAEQMVMHAYGDDDRMVIFLSSRSDIPIDVTLDPAELVGDYHHLWAEVLGVIDDPNTPDINEGDPLSIFALPYIQTYNEDALVTNDGIVFTLQPYEIIKLEFTIGDVGVRMAGQDFVADPDANYDDVLIGSAFDDVIRGGAGDDILRGNAGNDTLIGGDGNDFLGGWTGDDVLDGGSGNNTMRGGDGNDILIARDDINHMRGGDGVDQFIVSVAGRNTIYDFDIDAGEGLSFMRAYESVEDVMARAEVSGENLVIRHDGGGVTRLIGLGDRLEDLPKVLTDFQPDSPVSDLVDDLIAPVPDGSIPPDPVVEPSPPGLISQEDINTLLQMRSPEEVSDFVISLSFDEQDYLVSQINTNALALSASQGLWGAFCDNLNDTAYNAFIEQADPDILDFRYERLSSEIYTQRDELEFTPDRLPFCRTLFEVSEEVRIDLFLIFSDEQLVELENVWSEINPDLVGQSAEEIYRLDPEAIEARRLELLETDEQPGFAMFLMPGEFDKSYLGTLDEPDPDPSPPSPPPPPPSPPDDEEEEEEEEDRPSSGGGCFIATCAYGSHDHPDVVYLRLFRDLELRRSAGGRLFIRMYYRFGPTLAATVAPFPRLRAAIRKLLGLTVLAMQSHHMRLGAGRRAHAARSRQRPE